MRVCVRCARASGFNAAKAKQSWCFLKHAYLSVSRIKFPSQFPLVSLLQMSVFYLFSLPVGAKTTAAIHRLCPCCVTDKAVLRCLSSHSRTEWDGEEWWCTEPVCLRVKCHTWQHSSIKFTHKCTQWNKTHIRTNTNRHGQNQTFPLFPQWRNFFRFNLCLMRVPIHPVRQDFLIYCSSDLSLVNKRF